ncbi:MAG TPA: PTS sugar transporter subunit IIA [Thermosulfurimonas dismutans]|uniref:PTS sugar transporter subunit IIA n=1 Tax=Thermosulfurimonas dismutans TaxID=999894 RepID=A0A7C3CL41_9BACT|nr:PTS sugar transporter subunit IIA [Thermosulfurimonas dismutans]
MTGILVLAHGNLAHELVKVAGFILEEDGVAIPVDITPDDPPENIRKRIEEAISTADQGQGVLILTDLFGGTPSNLGLAFLQEGQVEVVCGVNLPMLIKALQHRDLPPRELAALVAEAGRKSIVRSADFFEN